MAHAESTRHRLRCSCIVLLVTFRPKTLLVSGTDTIFPCGRWWSQWTASRKALGEVRSAPPTRTRTVVLKGTTTQACIDHTGLPLFLRISPVTKKPISSKETPPEHDARSGSRLIRGYLWGKWRRQVTRTPSASPTSSRCRLSETGDCGCSLLALTGCPAS